MPPQASITEQRRRAIAQILEDHTVRSQGDLQERLNRAGFDASQPVLSRDLRSLGVAKRGGAYQMANADRVTPLSNLQSLLRSARPAAHFVLVSCEPGAGSAVARALEAEGLEGLVGTVAGDDTVLVALTSARAARGVRQLVDNLI